MKLIHEFKNLSVCRSIGGDYYIENDNGDMILILSASGSDEDKILIKWMESDSRIESDFYEYLREE